MEEKIRSRATERKGEIEKEGRGSKRGRRGRRRLTFSPLTLPPPLSCNGAGGGKVATPFLFSHPAFSSHASSLLTSTPPSYDELI